MVKDRPARPAAAFIPAYVRELFWDIDKRCLSWQKDRDMIIERVLSHGGWNSIVWLRGMTTPGELREWFYRTRGRSLDPPRLRFWELKLDLPHRAVNQWIAAMKKNPWHRRLHRQRHIKDRPSREK